MIDIKELHKRCFFESKEDDKVFESLKYGMTLYINGDGYIPHYSKGEQEELGKQFTTLEELDAILEARTP